MKTTDSKQMQSGEALFKIYPRKKRMKRGPVRH